MVLHSLSRNLLLLFLIFLAQNTFSQASSNDEVFGRWDLEIIKDGKTLPSWLEIEKSGFGTLIGRFVYAFGSARPIAEIKKNNNSYSFTIPHQWEPEGYMSLTFELDDNKLNGVLTYTDGLEYSFTGSRQVSLPFTHDPKWGSPILLFNGRDLAGWEVEDNSKWEVVDGVLNNAGVGANLITKDTYTDFKLHLEFKCPENGNSGVYLRGRYEVQVEDGYGHAPSPIKFGGVYGFLTPNEMVALPANQWQSFDITLIGNRVTVEANGKKIIVDQVIPGITGGALDAEEGSPGPIMIQGDHGPVMYRNIILTPRQ